MIVLWNKPLNCTSVSLPLFPREMDTIHKQRVPAGPHNIQRMHVARNRNHVARNHAIHVFYGNPPSQTYATVTANSQQYMCNSLIVVHCTTILFKFCVTIQQAAAFNWKTCKYSSLVLTFHLLSRSEFKNTTEQRTLGIYNCKFILDYTGNMLMLHTPLRNTNVTVTNGSMQRRIM